MKEREGNGVCDFCSAQTQIGICSEKCQVWILSFQACLRTDQCLPFAKQQQH